MNCCLLADSSFPATSVLLCAPLDPIRSDKHCIESCEEPLRFLIHNVLFQPDSFSNNLNRIMLDFMKLGTRRCNLQGRFLQWTTALELFSQYSTFTLDFLFQENKRKTVREIRLEYQTTSSPPFFLRNSRASETRAGVKITPREKRRSNIPEEKWGTTCSLLEYVHRGQTYLTASHSQLPYFCYFFHQQAGRRNLLAGVPLLPPPSRVLSRPNSLPCGLVVKIWAGVSKVSSSNPGRTYFPSLLFFFFFFFSFIFLFSYCSFFCFFILLKIFRFTNFLLYCLILPFPRTTGAWS